MIENKRIKEQCIDPDSTILQALKHMDRLGVKSLLVVNADFSFYGVLSIGDIQRAIIRNESLSGKVSSILRDNPKFVTPDKDLDFIKSEMIRYRMEFMPVVDINNKVFEIYFWEDIFHTSVQIPQNTTNLPVVIMAGGFGNRLKPLTTVFPKPLIPFRNQTIIEEIISRFAFYGCNDFLITINYKADLIEYYLNSLKLSNNLRFFKEELPMGTAGSLSLLRGSINSPFFVSNCDIVVNQPIDEIYEYHKGNKNVMTIVAAMKHYPIPYGILETSANGGLASITEKPELTFKINTGMYILEPELLNEIPDNSVFHITDLIGKLKSENRNIGVFPVSEKSWLDIGELSTYLDIVKFQGYK